MTADYNLTREMVLGEIQSALEAVDPVQVEQTVKMILAADQVFFVGVGRVLMSLQAIAKRFAHLGINAHVVGDVTEPAIKAGDLLIVGSGSGSSLFPVAIAEKAKNFGATVLHIGSNQNGKVKPFTDYMLRIPVQTKLNIQDEIKSNQPMTSLFEQTLLIIGDIIAEMIVEKKGLDLPSLWEFHANLE
ncbi:MAG: SIS domain-containing protein [Oscillospiraceae bacterium]|nr:SIS domain-containing protein [Oscillospiraceae bacterium]